MKKLVSIILVLAVTACSLVFFVNASGTEVIDTIPYAYGTVNVSSVNVRSSPSMSGTVIGERTKDKNVFIIGKTRNNDEDWYIINYDSQKAYIKAEFIDYKTDLAVGTVTAPSINVRSTPNKTDNSNVVGGLTKDKPAYIIGSENANGEKWYKIIYKGKLAYVLAQVVAYTGQVAYFPSNSIQKAGLNSSVYVNIVIDYVPKGYCLKVNGNLGNIQTNDCGKLVTTISYPQIQESQYIDVAVVDSFGNEIDELSSTLTVSVDNGFFGIIGAFFRFLFNGFKYPVENIEFK